MRSIKILAIGAVCTSLLMTTIFAADMGMLKKSSVRSDASVKVQDLQAKKEKGGMQTPTQKEYGGAAGLKGSFSSILQDLVSEGSITKETKDSIKAYIEKKQEARKAEMQQFKAMSEAEKKIYLESKKTKEGVQKPGGFIVAELVEAGILTQEQADAVLAKLEAQKLNMQKYLQRQKQNGCNWSQAVENGIITREQSEKITAYLQEKRETQKAQIDQFNTMSKEEKKAYLHKRMGLAEKSQRKDPLSEMVEAGLITLEQAEMMRASHPQFSHRQNFNAKANRQPSKNAG